MGTLWLCRLISRPRSVLASVLVLFVLALTQLINFPQFASKLEVDPDISSLLPTKGADLEVFRQTREIFRSDDLLFIVWRGKNVFTPSSLSALKQLSKQIEQIAGVRHVESLANAITTVIHEDYSEVSAFLAELPASVSESEAIRDLALANPLYAGYLVAQDGDGTVISVRFNPDLSSRSMLRIVDQIDNFVSALSVDADVFMSGPLFVRLEISRLLLEDFYRVLPLAIIVSMLVAGLCFRHWHGVVLPFLSNSLALVITLALFVKTGHTLNYVTVLLAPTIFVVGYAYSIHFVADFDEHRMKTSMAALQSVQSALADISRPIFLSALTTALGFSALCFSNISSIKTFGIFAAIGSLLSCLASLTVVPACLSLLKSKHQKTHSELWALAIEGLTKFSANYQRLTVIVGGFIVMVALVSAGKIVVSTDYLANFSERHEVNQNFVRLNESFAGAVPIQISLSAQETDYFKSPTNLQLIYDLQTWLAAQPEIGGTYSLVDYVVELERTLAPDLVDDEAVPNDEEIIHHLILLGASEDLSRFVNVSFDTTLIQVRANVVASQKLNELSARIKTRLSQLPNSVQAHVTGSSVIIASTLDEVTKGQIFSVGGAAIPILFILVLIFRTFRLALIALIPNVLPIVALFGIIGYFEIPLSLSTSLVAAVVLGIAVDDSIHFFSRIMQARHAGLSDDKAVAFAIEKVIKPVTFTTMGLALGFMTLVIGRLESQSYFGCLAAVTLVIAWLLDLFFSPALARQAGIVNKS